MKNLNKLFSICLSLALILGLSLSFLPGQVAAEEPKTALSQEVLDTFYEPNFAIELREDGIKKVTDGDGRELYLVPRDQETPEELAEALVIPYPVENAVFLSTTQVSPFQVVNDEETIARIGGLNMDKDFWTFVPEFQTAMEDGKIEFIGAKDGMGEPDYEKIQNLNPDIVFVYGGEYGQAKEIAKFQELGINYAVDNEYLENDYMARMEWIRFILTFFDRDLAANRIMQGAQNTVNRVLKEVEGKDAPKVAYFSVFEGTYYPTGGDSWLGNMLKDLGAINAFENLDVQNLNAETAFEALQDADIIIYSNSTMYLNGLQGIKDNFPLLEETQAFKNNRVYNLGDAFWQGLVETDRIFQELAEVFYPELGEKYYVHLDTTGVSLEAAPSVEEAPAEEEVPVEDEVAEDAAEEEAPATEAEEAAEEDAESEKAA